MSTPTDDELDALAAQLALNARGRELLKTAIEAQREIEALNSTKGQALTKRRVAMVGLGGKYHVSKYRLAKVVGVSQTTVGNILRD